MRLKIYLALSFFIFVALLLQITFSHHGLRDLLVLKSHVDQTKVRITQIESETRKLKHQFDVLQSSRAVITESYVREKLGWVKSSDLIYFESQK